MSRPIHPLTDNTTGERIDNEGDRNEAMPGGGHL